MPVIDDYLKEVLSRKGSDLHFLAGDPPRIRLYGDLQPLRPEKLEKDFVQQTLYEIMPKTAVMRFEEHDGADFAYNMGEYGRFRVNVMRHLNGMGAVMRAIPSKALTLEQLNLPPAIHQLCRANNGLILVTGKTGSGKSTTLAAMIDDINNRMKGHILTIEDPIEFVHRRKSCLISQRAHLAECHPECQIRQGRADDSDSARGHHAIADQYEGNQDCNETRRNRVDIQEDYQRCSREESDRRHAQRQTHAAGIGTGQLAGGWLLNVRAACGVPGSVAQRRLH